MTQHRITLGVICALAFGSVVYACQVPVFRYALERWDADKYRIVILNDGPLKAEAVGIAKDLQQQARTTASRFELEVVDVSDKPSSSALNLWKEYSPKIGPGPLAVVLYPERAQVSQRVAHCSRLDEANIDLVVSSPVRDKVIANLTDGDSATWIFVPSGSKAKDDAALKVLQEQLKAEAKRIELPSAEELEVPQKVIESCKVELRIDFSVVTLNRDDPAERFVLDTLLNSEEDLHSFDEPMAFPVFGRGRVLYALIGKGISEATIGSATSFITGPCSCQVKNQNPGFDLLLNCDWKKSVGDALISEPISAPPVTPQLIEIPPGRKSR